jgi:lysophospholipase L1-like esterase
VSPDPGVLHDFGQVMNELASDSDVAYLDAASQLARPTSGQIFLDACHLTPRGHSMVADMVVETLEAEAWGPVGDDSDG